MRRARIGAGYTRDSNRDYERDVRRETSMPPDREQDIEKASGSGKRNAKGNAIGISTPLILECTDRRGQESWQEDAGHPLSKPAMNILMTRARSRTVTGLEMNVAGSTAAESGTGLWGLQSTSGGKTEKSGRTRSNSASQTENVNTSLRRKVSWGKLKKDKKDKDKLVISSPRLQESSTVLGDIPLGRFEREPNDPATSGVSRGPRGLSRNRGEGREGSRSRSRSPAPPEHRSVSGSSGSATSRQSEFSKVVREKRSDPFIYDSVRLKSLSTSEHNSGPRPQNLEKGPSRSPMLMPKSILKRTPNQLHIPTIPQTPRMSPSFQPSDSSVESDFSIATPRVKPPSRVQSPFSATASNIHENGRGRSNSQPGLRSRSRTMGSGQRKSFDDDDSSTFEHQPKVQKHAVQDHHAPQEAGNSTPDEHIQNILKKSLPYPQRWDHSERRKETDQAGVHRIHHDHIAPLQRRRGSAAHLQRQLEDKSDDDEYLLRETSDNRSQTRVTFRQPQSRQADLMNGMPTPLTNPPPHDERDANDRADEGFDEWERNLRSRKLSRGEANRDSLLVLNADHQRRAFGIPPSVSDVGTLSSVESSYSVKGAAYESELENDVADKSNFSDGAELLFQSLGIGASAARPPGFTPRANRVSWRSSMLEAEKYLDYGQKHSHEQREGANISACSSDSSIYEEEVKNRPWQRREAETDRDVERLQSSTHLNNASSSWRKTLSPHAYMSLVETYGMTEMQRQEVIWKLCESEQVFLKSLRTVLKVFVQPLLGKNRTWVDGLPNNVSRLLDWFEDIFQLHTQISSALQHARSSQYPVVLKISETLRCFVPRLEVYQPYIVRLDEVIEEVEKMVRDSESEIGEFWKLRSAEPECGGVSFSAFLWMPLTRLGRYLKYFNELWSLTPQSHVDHLHTFSLLHSATTVVRVMREVKIREEEYLFVKDLISGIHGLPDSMQLMKRERRLLAHGTLQRIHLRRQDIHGLHIFQDNVKAQEESRSRQRREASVLGGRRAGPGFRRRANSLDSCLSEGASLSSLSSLASETSLDSDTYLRVSEKARLKSTARGGKVPIINVTTREKDRTKKETLYAFVFTDLALITVPISGRRRKGLREKSQEEWEMVEDIGICRILSVIDHSGKIGYDSLIEIQVLPIEDEELDNNVPMGISSISVFISIAEEEGKGDCEPSRVTRKRWLDALEHCAQSTLRSLSYPTFAGPGRYLRQAVNEEHDANTRQAVMEILASGLPLPKSPSAQMCEADEVALLKVDQDGEKHAEERTNDGDASQEREERGWWALRFQQTLSELQRESSLKPPVLQQRPTVGASTSGARKVGGRKPLKLGSKK